MNHSVIFKAHVGFTAQPRELKSYLSQGATKRLRQDGRETSCLLPSPPPSLRKRKGNHLPFEARNARSNKTHFDALVSPKGYSSQGATKRLRQDRRN